MQDIIRKILSIDQNARDIVRNNEQDIKVREELARGRLEQLDTETMEQAEKEGRSHYEEKIKAAEEEARGIISRNDRELRNLEEKFLAAKDALEADIFRKIFLETGEEKQDR